MVIAKESAPHLRRKASVTRMMVDVLIALAPTLIFAFVIYQLRTLWFYLISLGIMEAAEFVYVGLKNMMPADGQKHSFKERFIYAYKGKYNQNNALTAAITAVIYTLIMPAGAPLYAVAIGAFVGIVLGKLVFGGLGSNIFNPAAVGMLFTKVCFGGDQFEKFVTPGIAYYTAPDVSVSPTVLTNVKIDGLDGLIANYNNSNLLDMFLGKMNGTLGEVYAITILIGAIYLLVRRSADFRVMLPYLGTFALLSLVAGLGFFAVDGSTNPFTFMLFSLLSGGVLFGGVFMLTDPVTSPINAPSRIIYAMVAAVSTIFIRLFAALPEGVGFSILIANMLAVVLDHYEWSSSRYTWKKLLAMGLLLVIPALIIFFVIKFGDVYDGV